MLRLASEVITGKTRKDIWRLWWMWPGSKVTDQPSTSFFLSFQIKRFYFEITVNSHAVIRNSTVRSCISFTQFSLMLTSWISIVQGHNQEIDISTVHWPYSDLISFTCACVLMCSCVSVYVCLVLCLVMCADSCDHHQNMEAVPAQGCFVQQNSTSLWVLVSRADYWTLGDCGNKESKCLSV